MPYIENKEDRHAIDKLIESNIITLNRRGSLNYLLCKLFLSKEINYKRARDFIGEIECAKAEIYRRWIAPYEDKKIKDNGDI